MQQGNVLELKSAARFNGGVKLPSRWECEHSPTLQLVAEVATVRDVELADSLPARDENAMTNWDKRLHGACSGYGLARCFGGRICCCFCVCPRIRHAPFLTSFQANIKRVFYVCKECS